MVVALIALTGGFSVVGLALPAAAQATTTVVDQCNVHVPGTPGATTAMKCTVTWSRSTARPPGPGRP